MKYAPFLLLFVFFILSGCAQKVLAPVPVNTPSRTIHYQAEIKPILDRRCVVCHSCYNSPCQLKLSSYEGVDRGGTKKPVYDATRLTTMNPTRLFIDAQKTQQWREKDFFPVTESSAREGFNNSIMLQILSHKMDNPISSGDYFSEADDLTCSETRIELGGYLEKHPNRGMPFGFPPLSRDEFQLIAGWLAQGAKGPTPVEQKRLVTPPQPDAAAIEKWERFLNTDDAKHGMTSRYLYEHLFLAHITFETGTNEFYELVRSKTPPGTPVQLINSVRPFDDPGVTSFYYRFRKIHSTIVHKTHMVYTFNDKKMARIKELFIQPKWLQKPHLVDYDVKRSANPFDTFEQIPPRSRYQFLLDDIHYVIMTFIRGPVCRGQVALNVIHDHFWVMFKDPEHDLSIRFPGFLQHHKEKLIMPIETGSKLPIIGLLGNKYQKAAKEYYRIRQQTYDTVYHYDGLGVESVWKGNRAADAPLLTVYRHFDSASVHKGALGALPRTIWVMDYPLVERIYYALVAGFDVYGTLGHQLAVRLYMNNLRIEGESYFLNLLPPVDRLKTMKSWYLGMDFEKVGYRDGNMAASFPYTANDPKRELVEYLVDNHFRSDVGISFDQVNYFKSEKEYPQLPEKFETLADYLQGFKAISVPGMMLYSLVNDHNANLIYIRIRKENETDEVVTMIINRWHDNVNFLFKEEGALNHINDRADYLRGFHGSYPNYFIDIRQRDLPEFFELLQTATDRKELMIRFHKWAINRSNKKFWEYYDWFQQRFNKEQPMQAGLFDLNRYFHKAR